MLNLEPELRALEAEGKLPPPLAAPLVLIERRELMSIHQELRLTTYAGVALIVGALGTIIARNLETIGPIAIAASMALIAAALYGWCFYRLRGTRVDRSSEFGKDEVRSSEFRVRSSKAGIPSEELPPRHQAPGTEAPLQSLSEELATPRDSEELLQPRPEVPEEPRGTGAAEVPPRHPAPATEAPASQLRTPNSELRTGLPAPATEAPASQLRTPNSELRTGLTGLHEYLALLAALIVSADVAYIEANFKLLDTAWSAHLLILALLHAVFAYALGTRLILSLSVLALVSWFGVDPFFGGMFESSLTITRQALICAALLLLWCYVHVRMGGPSSFVPTFEHVAANLAFAASIALTFNEQWRFAGLLLLAVFAVISLRIARDQHRETFAMYAVLYALVGVSIAVVDWLDEELLIATYLMFAFGGAIAAIFVVHSKWRLEEA